MLSFFSFLSGLVGTVLTPVMLFFSSIVVALRSDFFRVISPKRFFHLLGDLPKKQKSSPLSALSLALAGTLGVGNITGVASAILSGGSGAVFWMWCGALVVLPVKYAEVYLAVRYRRKKGEHCVGGAMYYIRDGLMSPKLGICFAVLCAVNSLVTGNIVQANAAATLFSPGKRLLCGVILSVLVLFSLLYGKDRINRITSVFIPPLCAVYLLFGLFVILTNLPLIPDVVSDIFSSAFTVRAVGGGIVGFSVREAIRFGVMRGIFSNEAGCGTSPTAHASADTKSPRHQACYGIVEVIFDTLILCTVTAFVLLIGSHRIGGFPWRNDGDCTALVLDLFSSLTSPFVGKILALAVFFFAFSTVIAQLYYGYTAVEFCSDKKTPRVLYTVLSVACPIVGSVISSPVMWTLADLIIGIMTAVNCMVIILLRHRLR